MSASPLPAPSPLAALEPPLDRGRLHVFVAGPGVGEGIAVALPDAGWVLIDGCEVGSASPLAAILERFKRPDDDPVRAVVLTHPHADHAGGFAQIVERFPPHEIWVTADAPAGRSLLDYARAWLAAGSNVPRSEEQRGGKVISALKAIERWESANPNCLKLALDGNSANFGATSLHVRAPKECDHLSTVLRELSKGTLAHANEASVVLELVYGEATVVLTGDLPQKRPGGRLVPTGWDDVCGCHPTLGHHRGMKLPHHGSGDAFHQNLMSASAESRAWWLTPFRNGNVVLPRLDETGLHRLLTRQSPILLTSIMAGHEIAPPAAKPTIAASSLRARAKPAVPFLGAAADTSYAAAIAAPLDPVWGASFDRSGSVAGLYFGRAALAVER